MERQGLQSAQPQVLLVGADRAWEHAVREAALNCSLTVDMRHTVQEAIAQLLQPRWPYSHVLAPAGLHRRSLDALAGLLDEVNTQPAALILLGEQKAATAATNGVAQPDPEALAAAMHLVDAGGAKTALALTPPQLAASLHADMLRMRFQPIVGAAGLEPIGLEALARLHHPARGILHPRNFIPGAMASGLEHELSHVTAARTMVELNGVELPPGMFVSVNLPIATVLHPNAEPRVRKLFRSGAGAGFKLVIEVLETPVAPDLDLLAAALARWQRAGFQMAIDDAGPALPHWRKMLDLPFDILKLDGAMVADPAQHALTAEISDAAKRRGMVVIAEGVETDEILRRVQTLGVDAIQGFLVCRPLPGMAVPVWLDQKRPGVLPPMLEGRDQAGT